MRASHRQPCGQEPVKPEHLERENERLNRENEKLRQDLIERDKKIAELERQLALRRQNSVTSSKPPSSDGLAGEQRLRGTRKGKSCRKPGGQHGHSGHWRSLVPAERVNRGIDLLPNRCRHCDCSFAGSRRKIATQGEPRRHQVTELPPIQAYITEYRCQKAVCPDCGKTTQAEPPEDVRGHFGPELTALIAYLTGTGAQHTAQSGKYSELMGRGKRSGRRALYGTGKGNWPMSRWSTVTRQAIVLMAKSAGSGRWWLLRLSSIRSL